MRKVLVLLTMAGLFLSAFPTLLSAQEATPVVPDPESSPTEVVNTPTPEPTFTPTRARIQISTNQDDPPVLMINGSTENQRTLVGNFLPISWSTTTRLLEYEGAVCEGTALREIPGI